MTHRHPLRVYYEDTDFAGIVYYANYLKFMERGRTEFLRDLGLDQTALRSEAGLVFAVSRVVVDYHAPARFDDLLEVTSDVAGATGARVVMAQAVWRGETTLITAEVTIACLRENGRPARLPAALRAAL